MTAEWLHQKSPAAVGKVSATGWAVWLRPVLAALLLSWAITAQGVAAERWRTYSNAGVGYRIEIPDSFQRSTDEGSNRLIFTEVGGEAQIYVYGGQNLKSLSVSELAEELTRADEVADVTYRAGGRSWVVLSGHYRGGDDPKDEIIYYTKLVLSRDRTRAAGFEISYPVSEKRKMDAVVTRIEHTFRGP